ncbi:unnamed protein product [Agarophyton chilense]
MPPFLLRLKGARVLQAALLSTVMSSPREQLLPLSCTDKPYRPIANPTPVGLIGFSIAITLSSVPKLLDIDPLDPLLFAVALSLGSFAQLFAAYYHFLLNNLHAANTFALFGFHWLAQALYTYSSMFATPRDQALNHSDHVFALVYNVLFALSALVLWIPSFRIDRRLCATLFLLIVTYSFDAVALFQHRWAAIISGVAGVFASIISHYMAFAILFADACNGNISSLPLRSLT